MGKYIVRVTETNYGFAEIEGDSVEEAQDKAQDVYNAGSFIWTDSSLSGFSAEKESA